MKKLATAVALVVGMTAVSQADLLLEWSFSGATPVVSQVANSIDSRLDTGGSYNDLTRGAGAGTSTGNSSFRTTGFQNNGISTANTDYFQMIISGGSGYSLSLSGISGVFVGTTSYAVTPGVSMQWAYSFDGSTFTLIDSPVALVGVGPASFDFSGTAALQSIADSTDVTLRFYATGQTSTGGWGFGGNSSLQVNGTLAAVPEPSVLALLSIGGLAIARFARRRTA